MSDEPNKVDDVTGTETTGHVWDGIQELNNPLPRWWLWCLYLTIIWGVGYTIAYPAWPMISRATSGVLGYSTRAEVAVEIARMEEANSTLNAELAAADLTTLGDNPELQRFATAAGASVFANNCSQCHGSGAAGSVGFPNLLDDDWLWGGDVENIAYSVRHGIRNEADWDARWSEMPAFGDILERDEIDSVVQYVMSISGAEHDADMASAGAEIFLDQCSSCHMDDATGSRDLGAPNLTDAVWLYGGDPESLTETVTNARFGVMPPWGDKLTDAQINAVTSYVHQLGGGE